MRQKILPPASKPYFPMILANGSDVVLLDYSGSMHCHSGHCHLDQHQGSLCGWQKISHHEKGRHIMSLAFFPYRVMRPDDDVYEVGWFDQNFDPCTATLVTEARTHILHLRITAFLADGQPLYVERIEVLWADTEAQPKIALIGEQMADPRVAQVSFTPGGEAQVTGEYTWDEIKGRLRMAVYAHGKKVEDATQARSGHLEVRDLQPGDVIDRFITMQDTSHTEQPEQACVKTIEQALKKGFDGVHAEHAAVWQSYHANTQVTLPDSGLEYIYRLSLYLMRASQHPNGFTTHGVYNALWGGGACCAADLILFTRGWATANQQAPIKALADYYQHGAAGDMAREYAKQLDRPGANYPWFFNVFGRDLFFDDAVCACENGIQRGNLASMTSQCYDVFRFFGNTDDLRKRLPIMKELIDFMLADIIVSDTSGWNTNEMIGTDENIKRVNDTGYLIKMIRAMKDYQEGCRSLGMPEDAFYTEAIKKLSETLQENYRDGVIYPWKGAKELLSNVSFYVDNMPEGINAKSIRAGHRTDRGEWGLIAGNGGRDPNMVWPWSETTTAVAFSTIDPKLAWRRIKNALRFTDMHGFFVEKIRPDGFWINIGYSTPHATFVWALNSMLATDNVKYLTVARGLPAAWQDYSFKDIRTPSGYAVSLTIKKGKVEKLVVNNIRNETRKIRLRLLPRGHACAMDEMLTMLPGENVIKVKG